MKKIFTLLASCFLFSHVHAQDHYPKGIEEQIHLVENSLAGRIRFEGSSGDNLRDRMAFYKVKGLSMAVIKDYKIIWAKGYGWADENEEQPVTEKTLFQAASVSKSVNAMGVMKLVQDKKLDLSKDINDYMVSWKFPYDEVSKGKKITTLNLLTHTAGVNEGGSGFIDKDTIPSLIQVLNGGRQSRFIFSDTMPAHSIAAPGLQFQYSNNGVGITQVIVSDIAKKTYGQYMQETVFNPLEMTSSCYDESSLKKYAGHVAAGYSSGYQITGKHIITPMQAAGGLWTTPSDLARFIIEVQLSLSGKSNKVLSQETAMTMLTPYIQEAPGFFLKQMKPGGAKYFRHDGSKMGFRSEFYGSFENGYGVVVMINSDGHAGDIIPEVINSVATVYQWKDFYEPEIRKQPIEVSGELLSKCEGVYVFDDKYFVVLKKPDGGHLWSEQADSKMHFTNEKEFFNVEFQTRKKLILDDAGNVTGMKRLLNNTELATAVKLTNPDSAKLLPWQLSEIAWHLLENKKFAQSLAYFNCLQRLEPAQIMTTCNVAHCHLFLKEYDKAIQLYRNILSKDSDHMNSFKQIVLDDFVFFKRNGFDTSLMDKVFADLRLEKPKGYLN